LEQGKGIAMKLYGIVNCNTVKAARAWLDAHGKRYEFVDFKKTPPTRELLERWCAAFGWDKVLNRRGTTWRLLPPAVQARVKDEKSAIAVMLEKPSAIKRPVLENPGPKVIGFNEEAYAKL
jgi:arsenate reductase